MCDVSESILFKDIEFQLKKYRDFIILHILN